MVPEAPDRELDWISNRVEKVFYQMGHVTLVGGGRNLEFLPEFCQLKKHSFGFVGHRSSEV